MRKTFLLLLLIAISFLTLGGGSSQALTPEHCFSGEVINDDEIEITKYDKSCGPSVEIPQTFSSFSGKPVTSIGVSSFKAKNITNVIIPDGVISIGERAFEGNQLTGITIPNGVTSIGARAFKRNQLIEAIIPDSIVDIGTEAFEGNKLTDITIPSSVTSIGEWVFARNKITNITIPNGVTTIGTGAFSHNKLTTINIPDGMMNIEMEAFSHNELANITIPSSVTSIGRGTFARNKLIYITIPNGITSIGTGVFEGNLLTGIIIPDGVTSIGKVAFFNNKLTSVVIPPSVTNIGEKAFKSNQLADVVIPDGVTNIGTGAFHKNHLTGVIIPDSVTSIGERAFAQNQLMHITIPNGVTSIEKAVFYDNHLTDVVIPNGVINIEKGAFYKNHLTGVIIPNSVTSIKEQAFAINPGLLDAPYHGKVKGLITKAPESVIVDATANIAFERIPAQLSFDLDGGNWTGTINLTGWVDDPFPILPIPTKTGFVFDGRNPPIPTTITGDQNFKALWKTPSSTTSYPSAGGGGSILRRDNCPDGDYSPSYYDGECETSATTGNVTTGSVTTGSIATDNISTGEQKTDLVATDLMKDEQIKAYERCYQQGITAISGVKQARLGETITRAELAKMMSIYATNVLGKKPILTGTANYGDVNTKLGDLADYIQLAYQLQIMGITADGSPLDNFNPNEAVTRAEFATVLSRVLYGNQYNQEGETRYAQHLDILKTTGIISNTTPSLQEQRGRIMVMLMRSQMRSQNMKIN